MIELAPVVSKHGFISDLKVAVQKLVNVNTKRMVVADVWTGKISRIIGDDAPLGDIRRSDNIFVYELPEYEQYAPNCDIFQVIHYQHKRDMRFRGDCFGLPLLVCVPLGRPVTCGQVRSSVVKHASAFVKPGNPKYVWCYVLFALRRLTFCIAQHLSRSYS